MVSGILRCTLVSSLTSFISFFFLLFDAFFVIFYGRSSILIKFVEFPLALCLFARDAVYLLNGIFVIFEQLIMGYFLLLTALLPVVADILGKYYLF